MDLYFVKTWTPRDKPQLLTSFEKSLKAVLLFGVLKSSDKIQIQNYLKKKKDLPGPTQKAEHM